MNNKLNSAVKSSKRIVNAVGFFILRLTFLNNCANKTADIKYKIDQKNQLVNKFIKSPYYLLNFITNIVKCLYQAFLTFIY